MQTLVSDDKGDNDGDEAEPPVRTRSESPDTVEQNFYLIGRRTMSPTPCQGPSVLSSTVPKGLKSSSPTALVIHSLVSDDEANDRDSNTDDGEHTPFPPFSAIHIREKSALGARHNRSKNVKNRGAKRRGKNHDNSDGAENDNDCGVEIVGHSYAMPTRFGGSRSRPIVIDRSDQERKKAWSEVLQTEQELEAGEAVAISASEKRERR